MKWATETNIIYRLRNYIAGILLITVLCAGLFVSINNTPAGISAAEIEQIATVSDLSNIGEDPGNAIFNLLQRGSIEVFGLGEMPIRLASVFMALLFAGLFYLIVRSMYWHSAALAGTFLLASSSWFWHNGRVGLPYIAAITMYALVMLMSARAYKTNKARWRVGAMITATMALFTPLFVYALITSAAVMWRPILEAIKKMKSLSLVLYTSLGLVGIGPWLYLMVSREEFRNTILNLNNGFPSFREYGGNLIDTFSYLFWRSYESPALHLDQLPVLDVFTVAMVALGLFEFERQSKSIRSKLLFANSFVLIAAAAISIGDQAMIILLPFIYLLAANGLTTLLSQWQKTFPRNPIARTTAIIPLGIVLVLVFSYHYNRYFVAWRGTPSSIEAFDQRPLDIYNDLTSDTNYPSTSSIIVVANEDVDSFSFLTRYSSRITVITDADFDPLTQRSSYIYIAGGSESLVKAQEAFGIASDIKASNNDDTYIYQLFFNSLAGGN